MNLFSLARHFPPKRHSHSVVDGVICGCGPLKPISYGRQAIFSNHLESRRYSPQGLFSLEESARSPPLNVALIWVI